MSKIAQYLNEHLAGEVTDDIVVRKKYEHGGSVIGYVPEMVAAPRTTNDIRKILRFSDQLSEKGHVLSVTTRGGGADSTGGSVGEGVIVDTSKHMGHILEIDSKQRLVRVQAGLSLQALNNILAVNGTHIPSIAQDAKGTIGGAVALNLIGEFSGRFGATSEYVEELEVVLANGDTIQTKRLNKRELNKKKGQQDFEGEVYRALDNLISDNEQLIAEKLDADYIGNDGYASLARVKQKNGSFDLTPLFIGSQGTLGVISELIIRSEFVSSEELVVALSFPTKNDCHDALDALRKLDLSAISIYDPILFAEAKKLGKTYKVIEDAISDNKKVAGGVALIRYNEFSDRARKKKAKKIQKIAEQFNATVIVAEDEDDREQLYSIDSVPIIAGYANSDTSTPHILTDFHIPADRYDQFTDKLAEIEKRLAVQLPLYGRPLEGIYSIQVTLNLHRVSDKQKLFKLLDEVTGLIYEVGGSFVNDGRLRSPFIRKYVDEDVVGLYDQVRKIFDPRGVLNNGVKQTAELRELVAALLLTHSVR